MYKFNLMILHNLRQVLMHDSVDDSVKDMRPVIGRSTATLAHIRRTDNQVKFMFQLDGTNTTDMQTIWSNQQRFNTLQFQFESLFTRPDSLPYPPSYVQKSDFGIVHNQVTVNVSKVARSGTKTGVIIK